MSAMLPRFAEAGEREAGCTCPACQQAIQRGTPVAICAACGTVHHQGCYQNLGGCAAYVCAPARRDLARVTGPVLRLDPNDLDAVPVLPAARRGAGQVVPAFADERPRKRGGWSGLAITSFCVGLSALVPVLGFLTGLFAIILGSVALGGLRANGQRGFWLALVALFLGLGGMVESVAVVAYYYQHQEGHHVALNDIHADLATADNAEPAVKRAMYASVTLTVSNGLLRGTSLGSGVVLDLTPQSALIVTNRHVVDAKFNGDGGDPDRIDQLPTIQVRFLDQTTGSGKVVWLAPGGVDLALVRVAGPPARAAAARWPAPKAVRLAEPVFAIGNPHGLGWTHTTGTVSQLRWQDVGGHRVRLIQTQTALNPGNSGGGLFTRDGYLVGIATLAGDKRVAEGLNFAIALDTLIDLAPPELPRPPAKEDP